VRFERRSRNGRHWVIDHSSLKNRSRVPHLHKTLADPPVLRCGATAFRRVQLLVFKMIGKSGGCSFAARKNGRSGPVESLMRPTERVARLRVTNNSCLYPFSTLLFIFLIHSFSFPLRILVPLYLRCSSFLPFPLPFSSFIRRNNSNSCRKKPGNLSQPSPSKSLVPVPKLMVTGSQ